MNNDPNYPQNPNMPNYPPNYPNPMMPVQPPKKKRRPFLIGCGALVVVIALCGIVGAIANSSKGPAPTSTISQTTNDTPHTPPPTTKPKTWQTTHTYSGTGTKKTETFTVGNDWKIKWSCTVGSFSGIDYNVIVSVMRSDATPLDYGTINTMCKDGNSSGETHEHKGGTVYLDITSLGDWSIEVVEPK